MNIWVDRRSIGIAVAIGAAVGGFLYFVDRQVGQSIGTLEIGIAFSQPSAGEGETVDSLHETLNVPRLSSTAVQMMLPWRMPRRA